MAAEMSTPKSCSTWEAHASVSPLSMIEVVWSVSIVGMVCEAHHTVDVQPASSYLGCGIVTCIRAGHHRPCAGNVSD